MNNKLLKIHKKGGFAFWSYLQEINHKLLTELNKSNNKTEEKQILIFELTNFFQTFLAMPHETKIHISTKCQTLIQSLLDRFETFSSTEDMTAIIFVCKRYLAKYMKLLLQNYMISNGLSQIKIDYIIGHHSISVKQRANNDEFVKKIDDISEIPSCESNIITEVFSKQLFYEEFGKTIYKAPNLIDVKFKLSDQIKTIHSFRKKHINVLISTSVTEEGLDIPDCNLVISFSEPKTIKSFIQLKGRARKEKSEYLILSPESKVKIF